MIDWDNVPLGEKSDRAIAKELGCTPVAVRFQRKKRGITFFGYVGPQIDWSQIPLGEKSDIEIAKELGCTSAAVGQQRNKRGICRYDMYKDVDWSKSMSEIAKELDRSVATVCCAYKARFGHYKGQEEK